MFLQKIILTNFKNYAWQEVELSPHLNAFVGQNGMGKTNLLDAIYYSCMCKSHFGINDRDIVKHQDAFFRLEAIFELNEKRERIVAKVQPRQKKVIERNDVPYKRLTEHIGLLPVVMIVPDDTRLATDGSEERRRFLDNTLSQLDPQYLKNLVVYNRLLRQRNSLLKQMAQEGRKDDDLLLAYDEQMCGPATVIHQARQAFITAFMPIFQSYYEVISSGRERVFCHYQSQLQQEDMPTLLLKHAEKDRLLQRCTAGVHKDDLVFTINDYPLKRFASQGQLKTYVLAIKLAQYEWLRQQKGANPILLLDDIFDKLDRQRVKHLVHLLLEQNFGQICITDTHESRLEEIIQSLNTSYRKFKVENGEVETATIFTE